jgi:hypothetical protein
MRILVIGGYGAFGACVTRRLAREQDLEVIIAGRDKARAEAEVLRLRHTARAGLGVAVLDVMRIGADALRDLSPSVVVNASGPFQSQNYELAKAAIGAGCHYVDLADDRAFVTGIGALDAAAREARVLVASGASSVPGLSSAVVSAYAPEFSELSRIDIGISPGNSFEPGPATVASILGGLGKPFGALVGGKMRTVYGWQGLRRHAFPSLGRRWMGHVSVPDLDLFPARYPSLQTVTFQAGLEVPLFHLALWGLSWSARAGLLQAPEGLARGLRVVKRAFSALGSDRGGMFVIITGRGRDGQMLRIAWHLIAGSGHGALVPAIPCTIVARRLARGQETSRGAAACFGLMTLEDFRGEIADLDITITTETAEADPGQARW